MTERRLNMIIEKDYFDSEEVRKANAMNDKTMAPPRRIRLATTAVTNIMPKLYL